MAQTMKGKNGEKGPPQKQIRPGQRQQERLMRQARRRRRRLIWTSSIVAVVVIALAGVTYWQYQRITTQQNAERAAHATAVAVAAAAATATTIAQNCFISPAGTPPDNIYSGTATPAAGPATSPHIIGTPVTLSDGLQYIDIKVGNGPAAKKNSKVSVEYTGWLDSTCQKFSSSYDSGGKAFTVTLGQKQVIPGFDEGLVGIQPGGTRRLFIPPSLAYGSTPPQNSPIPPNATLIFDVTVLSVK